MNALNNTPLISLIMSVYNGEEYLSETLESILAQDFPYWELIAVNDCSSDSTRDILEEYAKKDSRIKVLNNTQNLKLPTSLNKALLASSGKYAARMDADDICLPDRLSKQYAFMEQNPDTDISCARYMTLKNGKVCSGGGGGKCDPHSVRALLLVTNPIIHPAVIAKSKVMKRLLYDTTRTCTEDLELWTRAAYLGYRIKIQDEYLLLYRIHEKQITQTTLSRQRTEVAEIQRRYYSTLLSPMNAELEQFYINGIYFREKPDIYGFRRFFEFVRSCNSKTNSFNDYDIRYAALEILAEYKRCGVSKSDILKGILYLGPLFCALELCKRKKRARLDGKKCTLAAQSIGYSKSGGSDEFPSFSK